MFTHTHAHTHTFAHTQRVQVDANTPHNFNSFDRGRGVNSESMCCNRGVCVCVCVLCVCVCVCGRRARGRMVLVCVQGLGTVGLCGEGRRANGGSTVWTQGCGGLRGEEGVARLMCRLGRRTWAERGTAPHKDEEAKGPHSFASGYFLCCMKACSSYPCMLSSFSFGRQCPTRPTHTTLS